MSSLLSVHLLGGSLRADVAGARIINVIQRLLEQNREAAQKLSALQDNLHRALDDAAMLRQAQARHEEEKQRLNKDAGAQEELYRQMSLKYRKLDESLRAAVEANKKLNSNLQYIKTHHSHDAKKKEREITLMKDKLAKLVQEKSHERKMGMFLINQLQRQDGKRGTWANPNRFLSGMGL